MAVHPEHILRLYSKALKDIAGLPPNHEGAQGQLMIAQFIAREALRDGKEMDGPDDLS